MEEKEFYTIKEFANKIGVHPNTVRKGIKDGKFQHFRTGSGKRSAYRIPTIEPQRICEVDTLKIIDAMVEQKLEERFRK